MSLPTGGLVPRSGISGASRITRLGALLAMASAWSLTSSPASAQVNFGATDHGFQAFADNGAVLASPDIAVGPDVIVAVVSGEIAWFNRSNQLLGSAQLTGAGGLWSWIDDPTDLTDVQVIWNANANRYYVAAIGVLPDGSTHFNIATTNTTNPDGGWATRHDSAGEIYQLSIGVYQTGIYAVYDYATGEGCWYFHATRDELLDPNRHHFVGGQLSGSPRAFACDDVSGDGDERMIVSSAEESTINRLRIVAKKSEWSGGPRVTAWINIPWQSMPPQVVQAGAIPLNIGGMDFRSAKVVNDSCWLAQTIGAGDHAIVRWYEVDLNGWPVSGQAPALRQTGDIDLGAGIHAFLPDIAVDSEGNAAIVFSIASANQNIALARAVRFADDPLGEFRHHHVFQSSTDAVTSGFWGAYVGIEADPAMPGVFWSHAPYNTVEGWKTWISKVTLAEDDVPPSDGPSLHTPDNGFIHNIIPTLRWDLDDLVSGFRVEVSTDPRFGGSDTFSSGLIQDNFYDIPAGVIDCDTRYYWHVIAATPQGDLMSNPDSRWFEKRLIQDVNSDGIVDSADLGMLISKFNTSTPAVDFNGDGIVNSADLGSLIGVFGQSCN
jgi:hypothetical protein